MFTNISTHPNDPEQAYQAGDAAFRQGNFPRARLLASQCLAAASPDSTLRFQALSRQCWAANYLGDNATVEREAARLLSGDAGADQLWFDGLALFNLGLVRQRTRRTDEARTYFSLASQRYAASDACFHPSRAQAMIHRFFAAISCWASTNDSQPLRQLSQELSAPTEADPELRRLARAVSLYLRRLAGEDVAVEAEIAARQGVSRAYLAYLLLEPRLPSIHRH